MEYDDVELEFEPEALEAIADQAIARNIGARGLRAVMEGMLTQIMYDVPDIQLTFYPGISDIETKQCTGATALIRAVASEILLVEVTNADDVAKVEEIMNARISYQVGDGTSPGGAWYPETMDQWENNSRVVSVGNSVILVVMDNADEIVTEFQNLFA